MTGKRWLAAVGLVVALAAPGCVSCGHQVCKPALDAGPTCEVPLAVREHVYLILVDGITPALAGGLTGLRDQLAARGFAKTYTGQLCHVWWLEMEMKRIHAEDPSARFVVAGYDFGCPSAVGLARDAVEKEIPVDALILMDPAGKLGMSSGCPVRTVLVHCGAAAAPIVYTEAVAVAGANHFTLPTHADTVDAVYAALRASAFQVTLPLAVPDEGMSWYEGATPPRKMLLPGPKPDAGDFLRDQPGTHAIPLTPLPLPAPTPLPDSSALPAPTPLPNS